MNFISEFATTISANGFTLLPITARQKRPVGMKRWQNLPQNELEYQRWVKAGYEGLGILCGDVISIDCDVWEEPMTQWIFLALGKITGSSPIERIGQSPKTMFVFRNSQQLRKRITPWYSSPNGKRNRIEALGTGQMFVSNGIHPDTGQEYYWPDKSPMDTPLSKFPEITDAHIDVLFSEFDKIALSHGWVKEEQETTQPAAKSEQFLVNHKNPLNLSPDSVRTTLSALLPKYADEYEYWIKAGMAIYHQTGGDPAGLALWDEWSSQSGRYTVGCCDVHWESFSRESHETQTTFATVLAWVKESPREASEVVPGGHAFLSLPVFRAIDKPTPYMWIAPCLGPGTLTVLYGSAGLGKSYLVSDLVRALHEADASWCGHLIDQGVPPVSLILDGEMPGDLLDQRIDDAFTPPLPTDVHLFSVMQSGAVSFDLSKEVCRDWVDRELERLHGNALIIDNKTSLVLGVDENSVQENLPIIAWLSSVRASGVMVIVVHHANKTGTQRGTSAYDGIADNVLKLTKGPGGETSRYLIWEKARRGRPPGTDEMQTLEMTPQGQRPVTFEPMQNVTSQIQRLLANIEAFPVMLLQTRADKLHLNRSTAQNRIRDALANGYITQDGSERKPRYEITKLGELSRVVNNDMAQQYDEFGLNE